MTWMLNTVAARCSDTGWPIAVMVSVGLVCTTALLLYAWHLTSHPQRRTQQPTTGPGWTYERTVKENES